MPIPDIYPDVPPVNSTDPIPLTDTARDALYKASESIKEGMWCAGSWFLMEHPPTAGYPVDYREAWDISDLLTDETNHPLSLSDAIKSRRCAEGEVALQVALLNGNLNDYYIALDAVQKTLRKSCDRCANLPVVSLATHNDNHIPMLAMPKLTPGTLTPYVEPTTEAVFEHLSELFRRTADTAL